ncbi:TPA: hypothetical protein ACNUUR_000105 [Aeromonas salmonicida]
MMTSKCVFFICFSSALISGCSSNLSAVDKLTSSTQNDGGISSYFNDIPFQSRFLAINGQLPIDTVGIPCVASSYRVPYSMICLSTDKSRVIEYDYPVIGNPDEKIKALKVSITDLERKSQELVIKLLVKATCQNAKNEVCTAEVDSFSTAQLEFKTLQKEVLSKLSDGNTFIFQWSSTAGGGFDAEAEPYGSFGGQGGYQNSGITIVSGLRISQLLVGNDISSIYKNLPSDTKLATFVMQAQGIAYISTRSISATVQARLGLTPTQFSDIISTLSEAQKIQLAAAFNYVNSLSNEGQFSTVDKSIRDVPTWGATGKIEDHGYQTFYATMTKLDELNKMIERK